MRYDEIWCEKRDAIIADFLNGVDSDDVFRARLYGLGFRSNDLENEFNYQKLQRMVEWRHRTLNGKLKIA